MENLPRKERDTDATVSEEGAMVIRTKLGAPLLHKAVVAHRRPVSSLGRAAGRGASPDRLE